MVLASDAPAISHPPLRRGHIIDALIEERAPHLAAAIWWPVLRPPLYALLDYGHARRLADSIAPMGGREALDYCSRLLSLRTQTRFFERIPRRGRLVIVANHPTGVADGMAVHDALKAVRPDAIFFANSDAHRICPGFAEVLIPVEWVEAKRTREQTRLTLAMTRQALEAEQALMIFPAGRISRHGPGGLADLDWAPTAVSIARKYGAPILPLHLAGPSSRLFHLFDRISPELRDITLFHEILDKRGRLYRLTAGPPVDPEALPRDAAEAAKRLKAYIERELCADPERALP